MKRLFIHRLLILTAMGFGWSCRPATHEAVPPPPNVLFIAIDDLRPELGAYGNQLIHSPNIDKLAQEGCLFTNHYVVVPTCGASRSALLTGLLPKTTQHLRNNVMAVQMAQQPEREAPETFIHHLRRNGYYTVGIGKISHHPDGLVYGYEETPKDAPQELPHSWDEMLLDIGHWGTGWNAFFGYAGGTSRTTLDKQVKPYEIGDVGDEGYPDGLTTRLAVRKLQELKQKDQPFFLGVGYFKPHLPFTAPKKYWDLYDREKIPLSPSPDIPEHISLTSLHNNGEFGNYEAGDEKATLSDPVSDAYARKLRHGYYACVSYIDAQVGEVLAALDEQGLSDNTIVVVWGDHGWHLGDHRIWGKHTCFEWALRSAFILKAPSLKGGIRQDAIVSTVDLYPTLMDLCGIEMPQETDGQSLVELMQNETTGNWRNSAYGYFRQGITVRNDRYRLTKYFRDEEPTVELYDHVQDPYENINIADAHPETVQALMPLLEEGNTGLYSQQ